MRSATLVAAVVLAGLASAGARAESAHFGLAATFPGDGEGNTPPQSSFMPDVPKITLGVQLRHVKYGDIITAAWIAEHAEGAPDNYEIATYDIMVDKRTGEVIAFRLARPEAGWPVGGYRVDVSINEEVELSQRFVVAPRE